MKGDWIVTRPRTGGGFTLPAVSRVEGMDLGVNIMGVIPPWMTAEDALDLGHRLVEAGLGARSTDRP